MFALEVGDEAGEMERKQEIELSIRATEGEEGERGVSWVPRVAEEGK